MANNTTELCLINPDLDMDSEQCLHRQVLNMTSMETYTFVIFFPVNIFIMILGVCGNTIAYVVMSKEMDASCSTICLRALAIADNMVLVTFGFYFSLPQLWKYFGMCLNCLVLLQYIKPYLWSGMWFSKTLSVYILVQMTVERFIAVCMPLRAIKYCTKTAARRGIVAIVILDIAYQLPKVFQYRRYSECDPCTGQILPNTALSGFYFNSVFRILYTKTLFYLIMFIIPVTVLFYLNIRLIVQIKRARRFRRSSIGGNASSSDDNATEKIIGVVVAFLILETPALIYNILTIFRDHTDIPLNINWVFLTEVMRSTYVISMINSFINIYIYCLVGRRFRRVLWRTLCCKRRPVKRYDTMMKSRRTSATVAFLNDTRRPSGLQTNVMTLSGSSTSGFTESTKV